jgi:LacI family transcriptional regulator
MLPASWRTDLPGLSERGESERFAPWLLRLPRGCQLITPDDGLARFACERALVHRRPIPGDLSLLTVDLGLTQCAAHHPPISAVDLDWEGMGRAAATAILRGRRSDQRVAVPPAGVSMRDTTRSAAETGMASAERIMGERLHQALSVSRLARIAGMSERSFHRQFRERHGCSPVQRLIALRLDRAEELLRTTTLTVAEVARRCGLASAQRLAHEMRRKRGSSPTEWRTATAAQRRD